MPCITVNDIYNEHMATRHPDSGVGIRGLASSVFSTWTWANSVTSIRILLAPTSVALLLAGARLEALGIFIFAALTDLVDGRLARARNEVTDIGGLLDATADKVLIGSLLLTFVIRGELAPFPILGLLVIQIARWGVGALYLARNRPILHARPAGKISDWFFCLLIIAVFLNSPLHLELLTLALISYSVATLDLARTALQRAMTSEPADASGKDEPVSANQAQARNVPKTTNGGVQKTLDILVPAIYTLVVGRLILYVANLELNPLFGLDRAVPLGTRIPVIVTIFILITFWLVLYFDEYHKLADDSFLGKALLLLSWFLVALCIEVSLEVQELWVFALGAGAGMAYLKNWQLYRRYRRMCIGSREAHFKRWKNLTAPYALYGLGVGTVAWFILALNPERFTGMPYVLPVFGCSVNLESWMSSIHSATSVVCMLLVVSFVARAMYLAHRREQEEQAE